MKLTRQPKTPWERLKATAEWASTSERREVEVTKEVLFWAVQELSKWEMVKGTDLDLPDNFEVSEQQPINDEPPL
jgi:hypothetical protein